MKPSTLKLDYNAFHLHTLKNRSVLDAEELEWLHAWEMWDLACSPMVDSDRKLIRYGHYLGWIARKPKQ